MKKIIKITESELVKIIKKILKEDTESLPEMVDVIPNDVVTLQNVLIDKGYDVGSTGADGIYGKNTKNAVIKFQKDNKINPDGIVGPVTAKLLRVNPITTNKSLLQNKLKTIKPSSEKEDSSKTYLLFDGEYLNWIENGKVVKKWKAYSGRTKWNTFGDKTAQKYVDTVGQDKEQFMKIGNAGPIPSGNYIINQIQKRTKGNALSLLQGKKYRELFDLMMKSDTHDWNTGTTGDLIAWGDYRCPITPVKGTNTYGRGSFYIHGGGIAGSIGCIDLLLEIDDFAKTFQNWKNTTKNNNIKLIVKY